MTRILLLLVIILMLCALVWGTPRFAPRTIVINWLKKNISWLALLLLCLFIVSGKLSAVFAIFGLVFAALLRIAPLLIKYAPQLLKLWTLFSVGKKYTHQREYKQSPTRTNTLSKEQALEILGLKSGATETEIVAAHRKLIAKMHPDRGGSDYLAAQINLAKKVLLSP